MSEHELQLWNNYKQCQTAFESTYGISPFFDYKDDPVKIAEIIEAGKVCDGKWREWSEMYGGEPVGINKSQQNTLMIGGLVVLGIIMFMSSK